MHVPIYYDEIEAAGNSRTAVAGLRGLIKSKFLEFMTLEGSQHHLPGSLIPQNDESVLFTGSTISTFKPHIKDGVPPRQPMHMVQRCLRTQNQSLFKDGAPGPPKWSSLFWSIGSLDSYDNIDKVSERTFKFFTQAMGIPEDRLRVRSARKDRDLCHFWEKNGMNHMVEYDVNQPVYYTHKFGMSDTFGRNCNLAIIDHRTSELRDIGNIIVLEKDGRPFAVETAFGVETIVSRVLGLQTPIHATLAADIVGSDEERKVLLADAIGVSTSILRAGEFPWSTNRGRILRTYLQGYSKLSEQVGFTPESLRQVTSKFEAEEFGEISWVSDFMVDYAETYNRLRKDNQLSAEVINKRLSDHMASFSSGGGPQSFSYDQNTKATLG